MTEFYAHEAWCPKCHVSHPPGTRRCLHCGGGVMPVRPGAVPRAATPPGRGPIEIPTRPEIVDEEDEPDAAPTGRRLRTGMALIWVVLAVVGTLLRTCAERG